MHPSVERRGPFFTAATGRYPKAVCDFFDGVAETYLLRDEETRKTNPVTVKLVFLPAIFSFFLLVHESFPLYETA